MLDVFGTIVLAAAIALNISAISAALSRSTTGRAAVAIVAGAWTGLAAAVAADGDFANAAAPFPVIGIFVALPLLAAGAAAIFVPRARAALAGIPLPLLIGLNIARALGGLFLLLALAGRLDGPFPQSAGWGDVITGLLAIALVRPAAKRTETSDRAVWLWNAFGLLDLISAVTLGVTSANGSPLQLIHAGAGSAAVQMLPWALIPSVLVPFYLITHGIIFAQLHAARRSLGREGHGQQAVSQAGR